MSINDIKLNEFALKLQKDSNVLSKHQLFDLTFNFGIHENQTIELMAKVAKYGSYVTCGLGLLSVLIGILALIYGQIYLTVFALVCILQLTVGPLANQTFDEGKRIMFAILCSVNQLWIGLALIYFTSSLFLQTTEEDNSFDNNIMHHFFFFIYLMISIALQVVHTILGVKLIRYFEKMISQFNVSKT